MLLLYVYFIFNDYLMNRKFKQKTAFEREIFCNIGFTGLF